MRTTSLYPVLMSADVAAAAAFYRDVLDFEVVFEADWYVSLRRENWELAILSAGHETVPAGYGVSAQGVLLNIEVDDVDAVHADLSGRSAVREVLALRSEDFGQRHFIIAGPDGVLVDVIQPIEPSAEFADAYQSL